MHMGSTFPGTEDRGHLLRTKDTWFGDRHGLGSGVRLGGWGRLGWSASEVRVRVCLSELPRVRSGPCAPPESTHVRILPRLGPGSWSSHRVAGPRGRGAGRKATHGFPPTSLTEVPLTSSKTSARCWHGSLPQRG